MKVLFITLAISIFELGIGMFCGRVIHGRAAHDTVEEKFDSCRTL